MLKLRMCVLLFAVMVLTVFALTIGQSIFAADKVGLQVMTQRVEDKAYYDLINAKFEKENPAIHVNYDAVPTKDYEQVITARLAINAVDTLASPPQIADPDKRRALFLDLTGQPFVKYVFADAVKAAIYPGDNGALYGIPMNSVSIVVFYNKKIFHDLNIAIPKTFYQFISACKKIKAKGIDPLIFGGKDQWPVNMIVIGMEAPLVSAVDTNWYAKLKTGEVKVTDRGTWLEVFKRLNTMKDYYNPGCLGLGYGQAPGMFAQGKAAMMLDGSWSAADIEKAKPDFEVGAFLMPASDKMINNKVAAVRPGFYWSIVKNSPNKQAALKYTEFLLRPDNYQIYTDMVKMLPMEKGIKMEDPLANEIAGLLSRQVDFFENKVLVLIPGIKFNYTPYALEIFAGMISPEQAAAKVQAEIDSSKPNWK